MVIFKVLNKVLGAVLLTLLFAPLIALITISRLFNFIDLLYNGKIGQAFISLVFAPLSALLTAIIGVISLLEHGWKTGLINLMLTFPVRVMHFFNKQLLFGTQKKEAINDLFLSPMSSSGLNDFVTSGFFGKLTLKLISLCLPMEICLSYDTKLASPHNDVSIYFTEINLDILKQKYAASEIQQSTQISIEINSYFSSKLVEINSKILKESALPLQDGKLQSYKDERDAIQAAQRCVQYFLNNQKAARDLSGKFQCAPNTVLNYIWLAINNECPDEQNKLLLKEKLIWALFQIQRGFNIVNGGKGADMPECPTGAIGLLVRVICDEQEKMPDSQYKADDTSPANLSLSLETALNRPFKSSYRIIAEAARSKYNNDPEAYKKEQKDNITKAWLSIFSPLIEPDFLKRDVIISIIDNGIEAWEPPAEDAAINIKP